jgi:hypothetical protein
MDVVARICAVPIELRRRGTVSVAELVAESGYGADPTSLMVEAVSRYLRAHPELIEAWFGYSEDKRTSSGWYVTERSGGMFEIGWHPAGDRVSVSDRADACAEFVVREVRAIAG